MYRPTVRMSDEIGAYVDALYHATHYTLDRNMIIRCALYAAPFSALFDSKIMPYKTADVLPLPAWRRHHDGIWLRSEWDGAGTSDELPEPRRPIEIIV